MKKTNILTGSLLAVLGVAFFVPSARAGNVTYNTGDLLLGFELPGNASDYVVDIGAASNYIGVSGTIDVNTAFGLGNIATDLSSVFGSGWATNSATQGDNVQWGIIGATSNLLGGTTGTGGTFSLPKNTIFLTIAEPTPGGGSTAPAEASQSTQGVWNTHVIGFAGTVNGAAATANSNDATIQSASASSSWSNEDPSTTAFGTSFGIEQPLSGTFIGPTNSQLDLYELLPTNAGGTGTGKELGSFTLSNTGVLTFTGSNVPEPGNGGLLALGSGILGLIRLRRRTSSNV